MSQYGLLLVFDTAADGVFWCCAALTTGDVMADFKKEGQSRLGCIALLQNGCLFHRKDRLIGMV